MLLICMKKNPNVTPKSPTESKTLRLKKDVVYEINDLAEGSNRTFNNMAETLMKLGMKHYQGLGLNT